MIEGSRRVDDRIIRAKVETRPGAPIDREKLRRDINRVYGLDDFQSVTFAISDVESQHRLVLKMQDKPWGPTYVRLGIHLEDDLKGDSSYELILNANRTRVNRLGGEWRNDVRLGRNLGVVSEFYQPLDFRGRFFVAPSAQFLRNTFSFFEDGRRVALFNLSERELALDLGMQFNDWGELRAGVYRSHVSAGVGAGAIDLQGRSIGVGGVRSTLTITRTDSPTIPREGSNLSVQYNRSQRGLGATDPHTKLQAAGYTIYSLGKQSLFVGLSGGTNLGSTIPAYDEFPMGGLLNLGGFAAGQIRGQRFVLARVGTYTLIRRLPAEVGSGLYAGIFGEAGDAWTAKRDLHRSITLMAAADTIIGPVFLAVAHADHSNQRFYVAIGKTF